MRKFVISDIHGNGNLYYSIISYIENVSHDDEVILFINGDLIDRGIESGEILLDVIDRINNDNSFKIVYLGGNHELMMYQIYQMRFKSMYVPYYNDWYNNGGWVTDDYLEELDKDKIMDAVKFVGNLDLYYKFVEKIDGKNIVLGHATLPSVVMDKCNLKIRDDNNIVDYVVWTRKNDLFIPFRCKIGNKDYFSTVGHTPNNNKYGYYYDKKENYLNIDGGSAYYVSGNFSYDHYPLVEIRDDYFRILTFNNNNEIIYGNYFCDYKSIPFGVEELNKERSFLNKNLKIKKLVRLKDGIIGYSDWE